LTVTHTTRIRERENRSRQEQAFHSVNNGQMSVHASRLHIGVEWRR
jgi:hypothetical protein